MPNILNMNKSNFNKIIIGFNRHADPSFLIKLEVDACGLLRCEAAFASLWWHHYIISCSLDRKKFAWRQSLLAGKRGNR